MELPPQAELSDRVRGFLAEGGLYPVLGTSGPDGEPHQAVIWYRLDPDDRVLVTPVTAAAGPRISAATVARRWPSWT